MNDHVNLMSRQARIREIRRTRLRQWAKISGVVAVLLVPPSLLAWWPVYQQRQRLAALESQYEPVREMIAVTKSYRHRIEQIQQEQRLALALAKQTPVVTLLGLIGKAVARSQGQVYVQHVAFRQAADPWPDAREGTGVVIVEGLAIRDHSVTELTAELRSVVPFTEVELDCAETVTVQNEPRQSFTIKGSL